MDQSRLAYEAVVNYRRRSRRKQKGGQKSYHTGVSCGIRYSCPRRSGFCFSSQPTYLPVWLRGIRIPTTKAWISPYNPECTPAITTRHRIRCCLARLGRYVACSAPSLRVLHGRPHIPSPHTLPTEPESVYPAAEIDDGWEDWPGIFTVV